MTPLRAIRAKCIDCCCGSKTEVRLCTAGGCPLHPYRLGHRPATVEKRELQRSSRPSKAQGVVQAAGGEGESQ